MPRPKQRATCHPEQRHVSGGLCKSCYGKVDYLANRDKTLARQRAYRLINRDKLLTYSKTQHLANRAKRLAQRKAYYHANKHKQRVPKKAYYLANRDSFYATSLLRNYGITLAQWRGMFDRQAGLCPICLHPIYPKGNSLGRRAAAVDHDHKTKRVRGLVCHMCNRTKIGTNTAETASRVAAYVLDTFDGRTL